MTGQKSKRQMISATEQERRKSASEYENQKTEESAAARPPAQQILSLKGTHYIANLFSVCSKQS